MTSAPGSTATASAPPGDLSTPPRLQHPSPILRTLARLGHWLIDNLQTIRRIAAFTLITFGTAAQKFGVASRVIHPMIGLQILRAGIRLVPLVSFLGLALGFGIVGQILVLLMKVGQAKLTGDLLVTVVIRELSPLTAALVVLARVGTAMVSELGTARALGEVEALEALGIDPIHYLVLPRVIGVTVAVFALAVYLILFALGGGYLFAYLQGTSLRPGEFLQQIAAALKWLDFPLLGLKTLVFGALTSLITCYHGLAQPLRLEEVGGATARTVAHCVVACLVADGLFVLAYLLL